MQMRVQAALDSRPPPQDEQPLRRGRGPLCETCRAAFSALNAFYTNPSRRESNPREVYIQRHTLHPSLTALRASARAGCPFCCYMWTSLRITTITLLQPSPVELRRPFHWPEVIEFSMSEPFPDLPWPLPPRQQRPTGLFRRGDPAEILSERFMLPMKDWSSQEVLVMNSQKETYADSPLVTRGWCFQEREISRRIIHYTETQVLWECRTLRASEGSSDGAALQTDIATYGWPERILDSELGGDSLHHA